MCVASFLSSVELVSQLHATVTLVFPFQSVRSSLYLLASVLSCCTFSELQTLVLPSIVPITRNHLFSILDHKVSFLSEHEENKNKIT